MTTSPQWQRGSKSNADGWVEVARTADATLVRDSKLGDSSPVLTFGEDEWRAFQDAVKAGEF
jgi:hypothetical protein